MAATSMARRWRAHVGIAKQAPLAKESAWREQQHQRAKSKSVSEKYLSAAASEMKK